MYNVFVDFHHASLLQSFINLFEKRLGGAVYRPIGTAWHKNGFWKVYDHPATVQQFLGIGAATPDNSRPLNNVRSKDGAIYNCQDIDSGTTNKAITLEGFFAMDIDIVIASLPYHLEPFKKLCEMHPNKPKLIYQIGNAWTVEAGLAPNIMASAKITGVPENINFIEYHQEFDTKIFHPSISREGHPWPTPDFNIMPQPQIASFVNVFNGQEHFKDDYKLFEEVERQMPGFVFKSYGGQCRDGAIGPSRVLAEEMRQTRFIWHTKAGGDGFGHIIHNAAAVGRPLIVKAEYYRGKMAEPLLKDGLTCITIDGLSINDIVNKIEYYNDRARYGALCKAAYDNFTRVCDFDQEFIKLQHFLANLV